MRYSYLLSLDTPSAVAGRVASFIGTTGDFAQVETMYANLDEVTPEDVRAAAQRWLSDDRRTTVVLRQVKPEDEPPATASKPKQQKNGSGTRGGAR